MIDEAAATHAVQESLRAALAAAPWPPELRALAAEALSDPTRVLGGRLTPWALLPLCCCAAMCGDWRRAVPAATAAEIYMASLDLCDEIEDGDVALPHGLPLTLNLATALLALAHLTLAAPDHDAATGETHDVATGGARRRAQDALWSGLAVATGGQHTDLTSAGAAPLAIAECVAIARAKGGALAEACCRAGAAFASADPAVIDRFGLLGQQLGLVAQLDNDMHDAGGATGKNDLARRKQTVPIAVARAHGEPDDLAGAVWQGGVQLAYALVQTERARAEEALDAVAALCPDPAHARVTLAPLLAARGGAPIRTMG